MPAARTIRTSRARGQAGVGEALDGVGSGLGVEPAVYQPMLSLHGHSRESRGEARIGRTLAINPGSEYSEGVLRGAVITLSRKKGVRGYQLVAG